MVPANKLMVTIHGVSSESDGLTFLAQECGCRVPGLAYEAVFWGKIPAWMMIYPTFREAFFQLVYYKLEDIAQRHPQTELTVVAHSFGTLAFVRALQRRMRGFQAHSVVFLGSIVPRDFSWRGWLDTCTVGQVLNIVRPFDWIVSRSGWIEGGYSGTRGFIQDAQNHFKDGGHALLRRKSGLDWSGQAGTAPTSVSDVIRAGATGRIRKRLAKHLAVASGTEAVIIGGGVSASLFPLRSH